MKRLPLLDLMLDNQDNNQVPEDLRHRFSNLLSTRTPTAFGSKGETK